MPRSHVTDMDLYGDDADTMTTCTQPDGYTAASGDCDDSRADAHPTAAETCNGMDDDCDRMTDEEVTPAPSTPEHCGGCGLVCPEGFECDGTVCVDAPVRLTAGEASMCALTRAGNVWCWGGNAVGEIGTGRSAAVVDPAEQVTLSAQAVDVHAFSTHQSSYFSYDTLVCATLSTGSLECWGTGIGPTPELNPSFLGVLPPDMVRWTAYLALDDSGQSFVFDGDWTPASIGPTAAISGRMARTVAGELWSLNAFSSFHHPLAGGTLQFDNLSSCATRSDGRLYCRGNNTVQQVGPGGARLRTRLPSPDCHGCL